MNPETYRCVRASGRRGRELLKAAAPQPRPYNIAAYFRPERRTVRRPRAGGGAFGTIIREAAAAPRRAAAGFFGAPAQPAPLGCPEGSVINPRTGRCIKITGRTYKALHKPAPAQLRRALSEAPPAVPSGIPTAVPLADRTTTLRWIAANCGNAVDPLTKVPFVSQPTLDNLVRLHDATCVAAPSLHTHVSAEHKVGRVAAIPGNRLDTPMTLEDFKVLRDTMRRRDPAYKIPARRHAPPPSTWQLYVAPDARSGPAFASVMYVDVTKIRPTAYGVEYPPESIRVNMGFIPIATPLGSICSAQGIVDLLDRLAKANKLLIPTAGGWRPIAGFPFMKEHWQTDTANRVNRLCRDLAKALDSPI
jgi:hypothetical protein